MYDTGNTYIHNLQHCQVVDSVLRLNRLFSVDYSRWLLNNLHVVWKTERISIELHKNTAKYNAPSFPPWHTHQLRFSS